MTPGARIAAAIEVVEAIEARKRPAADALKDWGLSHRFAGSGDRAVIASLVFDAQRKRASSAFLMADETPRASVLGALRQVRDMSAGALAALCSGEGHAPPPLNAGEVERLSAGDLTGAPSFVAGDFPAWLEPSLAAVFGPAAVAEMSALATRAPVDLRVNTLKTTREKVLAGLAYLRAAPTPYSPSGLRLPLAPDGRGPALAAEPTYIKGLAEIQDEGSQLAAILALAKPGEQVLDLCAGAGGKTLALAASMQNKGQIHATDRDAARLMRSIARFERAGVRNVQLHAPRGKNDVLAGLEGRCDLVFVDAPCTGTGTWRRNPDAKWRIRPGALAIRIAEQDRALEEAARFVKPRGRILYATCSVLREENEDRLAAFLASHADYKSLPAQELAEMARMPGLGAFASRFGFGLRLTPLTSGTDGFFIAMLMRC
ncbi:MAG TPA: RsmB/NOP family class I SAM-dependent RNA methyltransferase [Methylocella sp.]|nr:RsmB/NOP family class I SAM-dependent RNA methyltransferase [Methylocella sp.]